MSEFLISTQQNGVRLDKWIGEHCDSVTRSYAQKLIEDGCVLVNEKETKSKYRLCAGDRVTVQLPPPQELDVYPQDIPLDIVFEDDDLMVINKPQGMVVHPAAGNWDGTLVNAILFHTKGNLSGINGVARPGIVHRLDKDTSGLLVVAKTNEAHQSLAEQIQEKTCKRVYWCIVYGNLKEEEGIVDLPVGRNPNDRKKMAVNGLASREAVTHYRVLERFSQFSLVECRLETGRTHQIRVHMLSLGHPVLGDDVYSKRKNPFGVHTQMLHARQIGFQHPSTGEYMEFCRDPHETFLHILERLRKFFEKNT